MTKYKLKLKQRHPNNAMNFQRFVVTPVEQIVELNEAEIALLDTTGPKHWIKAEAVDDKPAEPVEPPNNEPIEWSELTNQQLKQICSDRDIDFNMRDNKETLISRIVEAE